MSNENEKLDRRMADLFSSSQAKSEKMESDQEEKRSSQADQLVALVTDENCELFHDQFKEPYAHILVENHWENHKIKNKQFSQWLSRLLWKKTGKAANPTALQSALAVIKGKACFEGRLYHLDTRVVQRDDVIWYDLGNDQWQAVKITSEGWEIVNNPPILFCRYSHQKPQVLPVPASIEDIKRVETFLNLAKSEYNLLLLVYLVSCFIPDIAHPVPIVYGPQGSAKSTFARILSKLIDPSSTGVGGIPTDQNEVIRQLAHHWFRIFDNVTHISTTNSDLFCRAVTGETFSKRELYSDDDDVIFSFQHCIGLNGINNCGQKPDLLERALLFRLEPISKHLRKSEANLWNNFEKDRAKIMGSIFTILSRAIKVRPSIELTELPRMADFTLWGCAITKAIELDQNKFLAAYNSNLNDQNEEAIQENPVALAVLYFMDNKVEWKDTASELLGELNKIADSEKLNTKDRSWPKSAGALSRKINEVKTNLLQKGILIDSDKGAHGKRSLIISNATLSIADTATFEAIERARSVFGGNIKVQTEDMSPHDHSEVVPPSGDSGTSGDTSQQLL